MSTPIAASEIIEQALDLSGTRSRFNVGANSRPLKDVNRALRWVWLEMANGWEGFAIRETEFLSPTSGTALDIQAGTGGANGTEVVARGVFQIRGLYRPTGPSDATGEVYECTFMPSTTYFHRWGVESVNDTRDRIQRPGYYWYRQAEDGVTKDTLEFRPAFQGSERIKLIYTPTSLQFADESDTIEGLNDSEEVIAHRAAYRLARTQDRQLALQLEAQADRLLQSQINNYKGRRDANGPDAVDRYRRQYRGNSIEWLSTWR